MVEMAEELYSVYGSAGSVKGGRIYFKRWFGFDMRMKRRTEKLLILKQKLNKAYEFMKKKFVIGEVTLFEKFRRW